MSQDTQISEYSQGKNVTLLGLFLNIFLTIFKFIAGILGNSRAMVADAVHSLSDMFSDVVVLLGIKIAEKPEDKSHQFGHGKFETLSTLIVCIILLIVGIDIIYDAIVSIVQQKPSSPTLIALIGAIISIIIKEILFQITIRVGKKIESGAVIVNAWHHRSDALSSIAALIGIGGSMLGYKILDSIAAIVVAILVFIIGIQYGLKSLMELLEVSIPQEMQNKIISIVRQCNDVKDLHKLRTRKVGKKIFSDIHILVDPNLTVEEGHSIASNVKKLINESIVGDIDVIVHIEPYKDS